MIKRLLVPNFRHFHQFRMNHNLVSVTESDGIRNITMIDTKKRNCLSLEMMENLLHEIKRNEDDKELRVIVLSSSGPVFSSGHNLKELSSDKGAENQKKVFDKCHELIKSIIASPLPVISKIDGLAAGTAGLQLAASCDIAICSEKSTFSTPGASFGIFCSTPGIAISRTIPRMKSSYMLLTGLPISSEEALRVGLVSSVVPSEKLDQELNEICDAIKSKSRAVVSFGKKFYYQQLGMDLNSSYIAGSQAMVDNLQLKDGQEGIKSFIEKRKPVWSNE
ncbi:CLUMA_CG006895, isoform A [Clunio marinus]|uniref:Enoyl-CoA hydratase domain-containing protein 3, mitochondrial n=1 Tax=Clunio marinus TaxID=568069 RepID=A0A1J1I4P2_9DIPT|nr:CLUMA_CG006895, isoform A [Clunio marinus]